MLAKSLSHGGTSCLLLVDAAPAFFSLPLPVCLFANPQSLAASQERLKVDPPSHGRRIPLEKPLVQHAQVRVACHECNGHNGMYRVGAGLLCDGEEDGRDVAVVPARTSLLRIAGALPATCEVSEHLGAPKLIQYARVAFYGVGRIE